VMLQIDGAYEPPETEARDVFGIRFEQRRNGIDIGADLLTNVPTRRKDVSDAARRDMLVALITLKYTQSNSVCLATDGQVIGNGAGQQSRIHCTRIAADNADLWFLRQHPRVLELALPPNTDRAERDNVVDHYVRHELGQKQKKEWLETQRGVTLGSDAYIPFRDNIDRAHASGVEFIVQPGGSMRDEEILAACDEYGMMMVLTGVRLFQH
jgi:phosphoribosylaminoimidazolecarboxamide formyltransferase/IMP cyclohydrolase